MNLVDQRLIDPIRGDCMRACLATILGVAHEETPDLAGIDADGGPWFHVFTKWLTDHGFKFVGTYSNMGKVLVDADYDEIGERCAGVDGLFMAGGPSPRPGVKGGHAVVIDYNGQMKHDPHPSRAGVVGITMVHMIEMATKGRTYDPRIKWGGYTEGQDRNDQHLVSHLYAWLTDEMSPVAPMCARGWNRSDGTGFSIFRGLSGEAGTCNVCQRRAMLKLPPMKSRPRKTKWI